jgi:hypothetical protein
MLDHRLLRGAAPNLSWRRPQAYDDRVELARPLTSAILRSMKRRSGACDASLSARS